MAFLIPLVVGLLAAAVIVALAWLTARRSLRRVSEEAARILEEARQDAENHKREAVVAAEEKALALEEETDQRERDLEAREAKLEGRARDLGREEADLAKKSRALERRQQQLDRVEGELEQTQRHAREQSEAARQTLERIAGLSAEQARAELIAGIEEEARREGARLARKIEDQAREGAERQAVNLVVRSMERFSLRDAVESTVTFIELPSDEMKGRIIGREGRNIRSLEMATGIDLIVDDTPKAILISSFDPIRREIARVAIERLVEDGRIHPARIEEVVERVGEEIDTLVEEQGNQAVFGLGISDLHPRLARLVGRMKFHSNHGQNLLRHCTEVALIAGHMASEIGARVPLVQRAGMLHEIGRVDRNTSGHTTLASAELALKYGEHEDVVRTIQSLHPDVEFKTVESVLLNTANRLSENRPGARKENLEIFVERLRRLEELVAKVDGVNRSYAVKAGKEIRVIVDSSVVSDEQIYELSKRIARDVEKELNFPGQVKVSVIRETRAVRFAV